jgi:ferritin
MLIFLFLIITGAILVPTTLNIRKTAAIWSLHAVAEAEGDLATMSELKWFIDEQVEEESSANSCLARVMMAGDDNAAILRLDHEFSKRE